MKNNSESYCPEKAPSAIAKEPVQCVLVASATDSGGCAGMMADLRVCAAMRVFAVCAVTAVTAQNSFGVSGGMAMPSSLISQQILCALKQQPGAMKIGLLPDADAIICIAEVIKEFGLKNVVLDTVAGATAGKLFESGSRSWCNAMLKLLPFCSLVTPNLPELSLLADMPVKNYTDILNAARKLKEDYRVKYLLVKGGHASDNDACVDLLFRPDKRHPLSFTAQKINTPNLRGTGCSLSSAIACYLAKGYNPETAVMKAHVYLQEAIHAARSKCYCGGAGPVEHFPYESQNL